MSNIINTVTIGTDEFLKLKQLEEKILQGKFLVVKENHELHSNYFYYSESEAIEELTIKLGQTNGRLEDLNQYIKSRKTENNISVFNFIIRKYFNKKNR